MEKLVGGGGGGRKSIVRREEKGTEGTGEGRLRYISSDN